MSQQQITMPQQSIILSSIRQKYFKQHRLYRLTYYKSLLQCSAHLKDSNSYQKCTNLVDQNDKKAHKILQNKLDQFEAKYRKNLEKCKSNLQCYQKQLKNFEQKVTQIYGQFYQKVTINI